MEQSEQINELTKAIVAVQSVIEGAKRDNENPFFKSKYADLQTVWDVCRKPLTDNGLAVVQTNDHADHGVTVVTTLLHTSGQWIRGRLTMRPVKDDPQGIGSCITYARRYALAAMVGIYQTDDDGEGASGRGNDKPQTEGPRRLSERLAAEGLRRVEYPVAVPEAHRADKDKIEAALNDLVARDLPLGARWITDAELAAQPELVRTMSVKPPSGAGRVRLIEVAGVDLQPCGGTHVRRTGEIGRVAVVKIENKGKQNRRVNLALVEAAPAAAPPPAA